MDNVFPSRNGPSDANIERQNTEDDLLYPEVFVEDGYICIENPEDNSVTKVASEIRIDRVFRNTEGGGQVTFRLKYQYKGERLTRDFPRDDCLVINNLLKLSKYGLDVMQINAKIIIKHLHNEEHLAPLQLTHEQVGWAAFGKRLVFKHHKGIGFDSLYTGPLKIQPKGDTEKWLKAVNMHVIGNPHLELALVLGLSAPVVGLIGKRAGVPSLLVHFASDSTRGKSTASMLAVSSFGYSGEGESSLFGTWLATSNAIVTRLNGNFGVPVVLDEASMNNENDFSNLIYRFAGGVDKCRLDKDSSIKKSGQWSTTVISNGEFALSSKVNRNMGIRMRLLEFQNVTWTKDAASADAIKETVRNNYGFAGVTFAEKLLEIDRKGLLTRFDARQARVYDAMESKDIFSHRISKKLALIVLTAEVAREALGIDINVDQIQDLLIKNENLAMEERDLGSNAYEFFCQQLNIHNNKFERKSWDKYNPHAKLTERSNLSWGDCEFKNGKLKVYILPTIFERLMKEGQFEDTKIILKSWKQKGLLDCESDRLTRKRKLNSTIPVIVYCIRIKDIDPEVQAVASPKPSAGKPSNKKKRLAP